MAVSGLSQCPGCSRVILFSNDSTNMIVCENCGVVAWRDHKRGLITGSYQFSIKEKNDVIQPGTTGKWKDKAFTVLGRFRVWLEESVYNYWTIRFDSGDIAWLGEGYGLYSIMLPAEVTNDFSHRRLNGTNPGNLQKLRNEQSFMLKKRQLVSNWEIEGEVFALAHDKYIQIADFAADNGDQITVFEWGEKDIYFYTVEFVPFEKLSLINLRVYTYSTKEFSCATCGETIRVKTFPYAQSCACTKCGTIYEAHRGKDFRKGPVKKATDTVHIPYASSGEIDGIRYEVIGYAQKQEKTPDKAIWTEYTLFNPHEGFAFLSVYAGHWIYVREAGDSPILTNASFKEFTYNNEPFQLYNAYSYNVIAASGEFPYNIFDNEKSRAREFISPPEMWIEERSSDEGVTWYFARHISSKDVEKNFAAYVMPLRQGTGAIQPTGYIGLEKLFIAFLIGLLLLLVLHVGINMTKQERVLFEQTILFPENAGTISQVTDKFKLDKWQSNIEFDIRTNVYNSWFELGATLVNAETGKEYSLEKGVEYYAGYSEGEHWTEGDQRDAAYLTHIPAGTYFLQLQGTREMSGQVQPSISDFLLKVTYDVPVNRNLVWSIGLLLIWPLGLGIIGYNKERNRWSNSPYSTYNS